MKRNLKTRHIEDYEGGDDDPPKIYKSKKRSKLSETDLNENVINTQRSSLNQATDRQLKSHRQV